MFYLHHTKIIELKQLVLSIAIFLILIMLGLKFFMEAVSENIGFFSDQFLTYPMALVIFSLLYVMRIQEVSKIISFFADISYSLYLLHIPVLSATMPLLMQSGIGTSFACLVSFAMMIALSYGCFKYIEKPGITLGRKIIRQLN